MAKNDDPFGDLPDAATDDPFADVPAAPRARRRDSIRPQVAASGDLSRPAGVMGQTIAPYVPPVVEPSISASPEPGFLGDLVNSVQRGWRRIDENVLSALPFSPEGVNRRAALLADAKRRVAAVPPSQKLQAQLDEISNAQGPWEALKAVATNPRAMTNIAAESTAMQVPSLVATTVAAPTGPAGMFAARVLTGGLTEGSSTISQEIDEAIAKRGSSAPATQQIADLLSDPGFMAQARDKATVRGSIIGAVDALTAGRAGHYLENLAKTATRRQVAGAAVKELGLQGGGGAAGELAAQLPTEDKIKWGDVFSEFGAELPGAIVEGGQNIAATPRSNIVTKGLADALGVEPMLGTPTPLAPPEANTYAWTQPRPIPEIPVGGQPGSAPPAPAVGAADSINRQFPGAASAPGPFSQRAAAPGNQPIGQYVPAPYNDPVAAVSNASTSPESAAPDAQPVDEAGRLAALGYSPEEIDYELNRNAPVAAAPEDPFGDLPQAGEQQPSTADTMRALGFSDEEIAADPQVRQERLDAGYYESPDAQLAPAQVRERAAQEKESEHWISQYDPLRQLIAFAGLRKSDAANYGADLAPRQVQGMVGKSRTGQVGPSTGKTRTYAAPSPHLRYFRDNGLAIDQLTQRLVEEGYFPAGSQPDQKDVYGLVQRMLGGERIAPDYNASYRATTEEHQRVLDERDLRLAAEDRASLDADLAMADNILSGDFALPADLYDALHGEHFTSEAEQRAAIRSAYNAFVRAQRSERGAGGRADASQQGAAQPGQAGQEPRGSPGATAPGAPAQQGRQPATAAVAPPKAPPAPTQGERDGNQHPARAGESREGTTAAQDDGRQPVAAADARPVAEPQPVAQPEPVSEPVAAGPRAGPGAAAGPEPGAESPLRTYTAEEVRQREEAAAAAAREEARAQAKAEADARAEREKKEIAARQAASAENFQLGQTPEEGLTGQGRMFDKAQSRTPPSGVSPRYSQLAFTNRPSYYTSAWQMLGISPGVAANLPIEQQFNKLAKLYQDHFGLRVEKTNALTNQAVDSLLDGFQNIQAMMAITGLPSNAVGLNGTLSLTLERYNAGKGYLGAYSPSERMIYMPGRSNSFGHEWMHALDHMMTTIAGHESDELFSYITRGSGANPNDRLQGSFALVMNMLFHDDAKLAWKVLQLQEKASHRTKAGNPTPSAKKAQAELDSIFSGKAGKGTPLSKAPESEYAQSSAGFGKKEYWANPAEMLARAFEAYLASQRGANEVNEFVTKPMAAYLDDADRRLAETFPKREDRTAIFAAFNEFFDALRQSNELGHGPTAQTFEVGEGIYDPKRWQVQPHNQPAWQRTITAEKQAYAAAHFPGWAGLAEAAGKNVTLFRNAALVGLASQRGHMNALYWRHNKNPAIRRLADMLYADRGHGRTVGATFHEAVHTRTKRKMNEVNGILRQHGLSRMTNDERELMRLIMVSAESMTHRTVVNAMQAKNLDVQDERIDKVEAAASDLRRLMNSEWYYNESNGIELGYTKNGYLPRILDQEKILSDLDGFERTAKQAYEVKFDKHVGTDHTNVNMEEMQSVITALNAITNDPTSRSPGMSGSTMQAVTELQKLQRQLAVWTGMRKNDPKASEKVQELEAKINDKIDELLPLLREDYKDSSAHAWRARIDSLPSDEYDKTSPQNAYTKNRTLPPEADVLLQDYYQADPISAITEYLERSTRRVEYAKRFGVKGEKLQELYEQMRDAGVPKEDRDTIGDIVTNATGREKHSTPTALQHAMSKALGFQTMYLLSRATFASLTESTVAFGRTGNLSALFKPFAYIAQDVFHTASSRERQQLANILGLVSEPFTDAQYANRLAGESMSKLQAEKASRFFERIYLLPLTRAQQRATMAVGHQFLLDLAGKPDSKTARAELAEMGIGAPDLPDFKKWLDKLEGNLPTERDLIDPHTGDLHKEGMLYATAQKRFGDQVIIEPSKMDRPRLQSHPIARWAFGIMAFQYAFWRQIYLPTVQATIKNALTVTGAVTGGRALSGLEAGARAIGAGNVLERIAGGKLTAADFNYGKSGVEAAKGLALTGIAATTMYVGVVLSTVLRAALMDTDKWKEHEKKGDLWEWIAELAFWRLGMAGPLDPLVQAFRGLKYQRDLTSLTAGPAAGSILQNIQDIGSYFVRPNAEGNNTQARKAARATYNLTIGPAFTWAAANAPGGPLTGTLAGLAAMYAGSGEAQERFTTAVAGEKFDPVTMKKEKGEDGKVMVRKKTPEELAASLERTKKEETRKRLVQELSAVQ